jgi:hypothetical protein
VAVSVMVPPTVTGAEAWVTMVGLLGDTTTASAGSPHAEVAAALLASPL